MSCVSVCPARRIKRGFKLKIKKIPFIIFLLLISIFTTSSQLGSENYQIGINYGNENPFNESWWDVYHNYSGIYKHFYLNNSGYMVSNWKNFSVAKQRLCLYYNGGSGCDVGVDAWLNATDNTNYAYVNSTLSKFGGLLTANYYLNMTEEFMGVKFIYRNGVVAVQNASLTYEHYDINLCANLGFNCSVHYANVNGTDYNISMNRYIPASNITIKYLRIWSPDSIISIIMKWNQSMFVNMTNNTVVLGYYKGTISSSETVTTDVQWLDATTAFNGVSITRNVTFVNVTNGIKQTVNFTAVASIVNNPWTGFVYLQNGTGAGGTRLNNTCNANSKMRIISGVTTMTGCIYRASNGDFNCTASAIQSNAQFRFIAEPCNVSLMNYSIYVTANVGTITGKQSEEVRNSPPTLVNQSLTPPTPQTSPATITIRGNCTDDFGFRNAFAETNFTGALANQSMTNEEGTNGFDNYTYSGVVAGTYAARVWCNDSWNNKTAGVYMLYNVTQTADSTPPKVIINSPLNTSKYKVTNVDLNYTATDPSTPLTCKYSLNDGAWNTLASCVNTSMTGIQGNNNVTLNVTDSLGNLNWTRNFFFIDSIFPTITSQSPINNSWSQSATVSINYTVSDTNLDRCWIINATGGTIQFASCVNTTQTTGEGLQNVTVYVNDTMNNTNSSQIFWKVDTINPSVNIDYPIDGGNYISTTLSLNFTASDTNLDKCQYELNGAANISLANCNNITLSSLPQGNNNIDIFTNDSSGRVSSHTHTFFIDSIAPLTNYPTNSTTNESISISMSSNENGNATLNWGSTSALGTLAENTTISTTHSWNITGLNAGTPYYFNITTRDAYGNYVVNGTYIITTNFNPDSTPPYFGGIPARNLTLAYSGWKVRLNETVFDNIAVDKVLFEISGTNYTATGNIGSQYYYDWTCSASTTYSYNKIWANDTVNNRNSSVIGLPLTFECDVEPPAVTSLAANASTIEIFGFVNISTAVSSQHLDKVIFNITRPSGTYYSAGTSLIGSLYTNITYLNETGIWRFQVLANDTGNQINSTQNISITVQDTTKPKSAITFPTNGTTYGKANLDFNYTASDNYLLDRCKYELNGAANTTIANCINTTITGVQGLNNLTLFINDSSNNLNWTSIKFSIDLSPPDLIVKSPINNSFYNTKNISLNYSSGDSTRDKCWYQNSTGQNISLATCQNITFNGIEGFQNIIVYVNDTVNNLNLSKIFFTIDTIYPVISIQSPANNSVITSSSTMKVNFTASDINLDKCWITNATGGRIDGCANLTQTLADGSYSTSVFVNDSGNNINSSIVYFSMATQPPTISGFLKSSTNSTLTFSGTTNILANWSCNAGESPSLGSKTDITTFQTLQNCVITGLNVSTAYYFNVTSCDQYNHCNSTTGIFATQGNGGGVSGGTTLVSADPRILFEIGNPYYESGETLQSAIMIINENGTAVPNLNVSVYLYNSTFISTSVSSLMATHWGQGFYNFTFVLPSVTSSQIWTLRANTTVGGIRYDGLKTFRLNPTTTHGLTAEQNLTLHQINSTVGAINSSVNALNSNLIVLNTTVNGNAQLITTINTTVSGNGAILQSINSTSTATSLTTSLLFNSSNSSYQVDFLVTPRQTAPSAPVYLVIEFWKTGKGMFNPDSAPTLSLHDLADTPILTDIGMSFDDTGRYELAAALSDTISNFHAVVNYTINGVTYSISQLITSLPVNTESITSTTKYMYQNDPACPLENVPASKCNIIIGKNITNNFAGIYKARINCDFPAGLFPNDMIGFPDPDGTSSFNFGSNQLLCDFTRTYNSNENFLAQWTFRNTMLDKYIEDYKLISETLPAVSDMYSLLKTKVTGNQLRFLNQNFETLNQSASIITTHYQYIMGSPDATTMVFVWNDDFEGYKFTYCSGSKDIFTLGESYGLNVSSFISSPLLDKMNTLSTSSQLNTNISMLLADGALTRNKITDGIYPNMKMGSGNDNSSPIISVWLANNSIIKPFDFFNVIIYNASMQKEYEKNITLFNNLNNTYWQIFPLTRNGQYFAFLTGTYNGVSLFYPLPFGVPTSSTIQYDVSVVCPATADYGSTITCTANFTRKGTAGDTMYEYYLEGSQKKSESFYQNNGESTLKQLTLNVNQHGTARFVVNVISPYATASTTFNALESGGGFLIYGTATKQNEILLYLNKIIKQVPMWIAPAFIVSILIIVIILRRRKDEETKD